MVLYEEEKKKPKKSKKTDGGSSEKVVKAEKKKKIPVVTADTVEEVSPILTSVVDTPIIEASPLTEMIPSKTGVFRCIKIKRKSQLMKKTQVTHQGVTVREIPAPNQRLEEVEQVHETLEIILQEEAKTSPPVGLSKAAVSKPLEISSLPQVTSTTDSPTFQFIMDQPFTTIFSTQSTNPPHPSSPINEIVAADVETDNEGFGGMFKALHFDQAEEDFPSHMLMTMKQFKILNLKLNSILQSQADVGSGGVTSMKVDSLMKVMEGRVISKASGLIRDLESRVLEKVDKNDISTENRINSLRSDFVTELKDLKIVTKERHVLFVQEVKKVVTKPSVIPAGPVTSTVITTIPLPKPSSKGVVIGKQADVSSSGKMVLSSVEDKGKGILVEKTKQEKKAEVAAKGSVLSDYR
ncbi:unnamed protein product [Lactuca saligna]|uniref:Uncharacterized protein n=1 Tax=Lactuca saligna TaxID=75948 RepID=A0AA35VIP4_LACSI|nr:unnamed protein product [Lactuca saligna]